IFSQPVPPEAVADNGDRVRVAHFIDFWAEGSAQNGTHAQHRKIRAAYQADVGRRALAARSVAFGCNTYLDILAGRGEHTRENLVISRELLEFRTGNQVAVAIGESLLEALRVGVGEKDQLLRILDRQIFQQHSIDDRENRRVGADAKRQREHCNRGEHGRFAQDAQAVADVLSGNFEEVQTPRIAALLFDLVGAADRKASAAARLFKRHAGRDKLFHLPVEVEV